MNTKKEDESPKDQNYALMGHDAVVIKIFENPGQEFVTEYNATNTPRIYACPIEAKIGWVRRNGEFVYGPPPPEVEEDPTKAF